MDPIQIENAVEFLRHVGISDAHEVRVFGGSFSDEKGRLQSVTVRVLDAGQSPAPGGEPRYFVVAVVNEGNDDERRSSGDGDALNEALDNVLWYQLGIPESSQDLNPLG